MANRTPSSAAAAVIEIRRQLADWLESSDEAAKPVANIMRLLEVVDAELLSRKSPERARSRDRDQPRYSVENTSAGQVLTEGKGGGTPPFKVPKAIYDTVTEVLAGADEPMKFEDIFGAAGAKTPNAPGDFQIRVCLRFWMASDPPLITRSRSTYLPAERQSFASAAKKLWQDTV